MDEDQQVPQGQNDEKLSTGLVVLSFCIPLAGAIIYFMKKDKQPAAAKTACQAALWGFGFGVVVNIIARVAGVGEM